MSWTKLLGLQSTAHDLSPLELPLLGSIRTEDDENVLLLKYLSSEVGYRTWRNPSPAEDVCVQFSENPFRVLKIVTHSIGGARPFASQSWSKVFKAFLVEKAPDKEAQSAWETIVTEAVRQISQRHSSDPSAASRV